MNPVGRRGFLGRLLGVLGVGVVTPAALLESPSPPLRWLQPAYPPLHYSFIETFQPRYNCVIRELRGLQGLVDDGTEPVTLSGSASGKLEDCKSSIVGSIPTPDSIGE